MTASIGYRLVPTRLDSRRYRMYRGNQMQRKRRDEPMVSVPSVLPGDKVDGFGSHQKSHNILFFHLNLLTHIKRPHWV